MLIIDLVFISCINIKEFLTNWKTYYREGVRPFRRISLFASTIIFALLALNLTNYLSFLRDYDLSGGWQGKMDDLEYFLTLQEFSISSTKFQFLLVFAFLFRIITLSFKSDWAIRFSQVITLVILAILLSFSQYSWLARRELERETGVYFCGGSSLWGVFQSTALILGFYLLFGIAFHLCLIVTVSLAAGGLIKFDKPKS